MNEHDKKEVMNLIKIKKKIGFGDVRMIYPQKWDFEEADKMKERAFKNNV